MSDITMRYLLFGEDRTASKTATKIGGAFSQLGDKIGGEVGELLNRVGEGIDSIAEHSKSVGKAMTAVGGVVAGVGLALQAAGSKDKAAMNALDLAIKNTGHSAKDYAEDIEKAVKANENYGISAADTKNALAKLTDATGDPKRALELMGTAANLAAAQHEDLSAAAGQLAKVLNGSGNKILKQYGINLVSTKTAANAVKTAENAHQRALDNVAKAQKRLNELTIVDKDKKKLSTSQTIALHDASDNLKTAQDRLKTATDALAKAMSANKDAIKQNDDAITKLGNKVSGRAAAQVDTFSGRIEVAKTKIGDWVGEMGNKFGPTITYAGGALAAMGTIYEAKIIPALYKAAAAAAVWTAGQVKSAALAVLNTGRIIAQAVASGAVAVATGLWTAAQWALNAALFANPVGMIILGIAALVAITILAWKHSQTFRNIVTGAFHAVLGAASATFGWIKGNWPLLLAILTGPVGLAVRWIVMHWNGIMSFFKAVPKRLGAALSGVAAYITAPFRAAFNYISDAWNNTVGRLHWSVPGWVPGIGGNSISAPTLPHFAAGVSGVIKRPGAFVAGDGGPEAISITPLSAGRSRQGGGDTYQITIQGAVDPISTGKQIEKVLVKLRATNGGRALAFQ